MRKRITIIFLIFALSVLTFAGCSVNPNLYDKGLEVTKQMEEALKSEVFLTYLLGKNYKDYHNVDKFIAYDYDTPVKVYTVSPPNEELIRDIVNIGKSDFDNLSGTLQEQLKNRMTYDAIITNINFNNYVADDIAFTASFVITKKFPKCELKEPTAYLYIFETGKPIMVCFSTENNELVARGRFLLSDEVDTLSSVRGLFEKFGCNVSLI